MKRKVKHLCTCLSMICLQTLLCAASVFAQEKTVRGTVLDAAGEPIIGANVIRKGTANGVITGIEGTFSLEVPPTATLQISYIGFQTEEVAVGSNTDFTIILKEGGIGLEEVVVIGYGTVRKGDLTGAVSVISIEDMKKSPSGSVTSQLQGLATGVNVRNTGKAGEDSQIEIRGVGTLSNRDPLWIIDGMISNPGMNFNPADIESIQVLKDASAAAIYGSRSANGVIIVTTRKGSKGPMKIGVNIKETLEWSPRFDLMNAAGYKKYNDMAYTEGIRNGSWGGGLQAHAASDTDWQDEVFRTGLVQDYNVSLSGGGNAGSYFVSGGYYKNEGVSYGNEFDRYSFRVNTEGKRGMFSFGENLSYTYTDKDPLQTNPYNDVVRMMPTIPVYDENNPGGYGYGDANANTFGTNPVAREDLEHQKEKNNRLNGSVWATFKPLPFLYYKLNAGMDIEFWDRSWFRGEGNWTRNQEYRSPESVKEKRHTYTRLIEHTLNFADDYGKHHIDAVAGTTYQTYEREFLTGSRLNFPIVGDDYLTVLNAGQGNQQNSNAIYQNAMISYLGRANYSYDYKYYLTATLRRDGTSRLSRENRWGNFPSFSAAWRISNERFFHLSFVDDLKFRGNWGRLGNAAIGDWDYLGTINQSLVTVIGGSLKPGAAQVKIVNNNLRWETKETTNIGLDALFLNHRLGVSAEYYVSNTRDVLTDMPIAISTGNQGGAPKANAASLRNTGFEVSLNWRDKAGDFNYNIIANLTTLNNEVTELGYGKDVYYSGKTKSEIGQPLSMYYLYKTDGIFRTQGEIDSYVTSTGQPIMIGGKRPEAGDVKYIDTDDNGNITANDRQIVGNPWPEVQLSLLFNASWKNVDLSMMWYGQFGNDIYNVPLWQGRLFADNSNYINFKTGEEPYQENPNSNTARIIYGDFRNTYDSDRYLENGSYLRLKNIQLGYTFPKRLISPCGVENVRLYVAGNNLITLTGYKGLDPDFVNTDVWDRGTDNFAFPNTGSVMFGLDLTF
ncbi:MAG: TonB-dependent receptor [Tannerellaceae bacterium]|nr:TonB-dependent receptor [Tannerellaceae bacterium]